MKKKEKDQLHNMTLEELKRELSDVTKKGAQSRNVHEGKALRQKRAVIATIMREKELHL